MKVLLAQRFYPGCYDVDGLMYRNKSRKVYRNKRIRHIPLRTILIPFIYLDEDLFARLLMVFTCCCWIIDNIHWEYLLFRMYLPTYTQYSSNDAEDNDKNVHRLYFFFLANKLTHSHREICLEKTYLYRQRGKWRALSKSCPQATDPESVLLRNYHYMLVFSVYMNFARRACSARMV